MVFWIGILVGGLFAWFAVKMGFYETWTFAFNIIICTALALWAPDLWWAIYNGILIYTFTGVLMVGEYVYRHFRFPDLDIPSPKSTIQSMINNGRNIWMDVKYRQ